MIALAVEHLEPAAAEGASRRLRRRQDRIGHTRIGDAVELDSPADPSPPIFLEQIPRADIAEAVRRAFDRPVRIDKPEKADDTVAVHRHASAISVGRAPRIIEQVAPALLADLVRSYCRAADRRRRRYRPLRPGARRRSCALPRRFPGRSGRAKDLRDVRASGRPDAAASRQEGVRETPRSRHRAGDDV